MKFLIIILIMVTVVIGSLYSFLEDKQLYCVAMTARHSILEEAVR